MSRESLEEPGKEICLPLNVSVNGVKINIKTPLTVLSD